MKPLALFVVVVALSSLTYCGKDEKIDAKERNRMIQADRLQRQKQREGTVEFSGKLNGQPCTTGRITTKNPEEFCNAVLNAEPKECARPYRLKAARVKGCKI